MIGTAQAVIGGRDIFESTKGFAGTLLRGTPYEAKYQFEDVLDGQISIVLRGSAGDIEKELEEVERLFGGDSAKYYFSR